MLRAHDLTAGLVLAILVSLAAQALAEPCLTPRQQKPSTEALISPDRVIDAVTVAAKAAHKSHAKYIEIEVAVPSKPIDVPDPRERVRLKVDVPNANIEVPVGERRRQFFTEWTYEQEKDRLFCYYYFQPDPRFAVYKKQLVVHYHDSHGRSNEFTYFYSFEKERYWGRCTNTHHPKHNPTTMQWHFCIDDIWDAVLTPGAPAVPSSMDGAGMISPPDPPL